MEGCAALGEPRPVVSGGVRLLLRGEPVVRVLPERVERVRRAKSPGPDERCQRRACTHLREQLAQASRAAAGAKAQYQDLHRRWRLEVEGAVRAVHAELAIVKQQLEDALLLESRVRRRESTSSRS